MEYHDNKTAGSQCSKLTSQTEDPGSCDFGANLTITSTHIDIINSNTKIVCVFCKKLIDSPTLIINFPIESDQFYHYVCFTNALKQHDRTSDDNYLTGIEKNPGPPMMEDDDVEIVIQNQCPLCMDTLMPGVTLCKFCMDVNKAESCQQIQPQQRQYKDKSRPNAENKKNQRMGICKFNNRKNGCTNNNCKYEHPPPAPKSDNPLVKAAIKDMDAQQAGERDALKQAQDEAKQQERAAQQAMDKAKKRKKKYDAGFNSRHLHNIHSFLHMVDGPIGITRPNLGLFIAMFFIIFEMAFFLGFEHIIIHYIQLWITHLSNFFPQIQNLVTKMTPAYILTTDLMSFIHLIGLLRSAYNLFRILFVDPYNILEFMNKSVFGRLLSSQIYEMIGVCHNNSFVYYQHIATDPTDKQTESRAQNRRDPDVRLPTDHDRYAVRRGNFHWPIDKKPPILHKPLTWMAPQGHAPRYARSATMIGYDKKISFTATEFHLDHHTLFPDGAYMTDEVEFIISRTLLMMLLSPRNVNRHLTFDQAKTFVTRDATSISSVNFDARKVMLMQNVSADTTHLALAWLMYDRQRCQIFTDTLGADFRLLPQH